jgi:hypothetical protein
MAMLLPLKDEIPAIRFITNSNEATQLEIQLRTSIKKENFTPDALLFKKTCDIKPGEHEVEIRFDELGIEKGYYFICFMKNPLVSLAESDQLITGVMSVFNYQNPAVSNYGAQIAPEDIGVDSFEFWCPLRRPKGKNIAMKFNPAIEAFEAENVRNEILRPLVGANAWVADFQDENPTITLSWAKKEWISEIKLFFDTDSDHAMENVQMGHHDSTMPYCVREFTITDGSGTVLFETTNNHQSVKKIKLNINIQISTLIILLKHPSKTTPAALYGVIVN